MIWSDLGEYHQDQRDDAAGYGAVVLLVLVIAVLLLSTYLLVPLVVDTIDRFVGFMLCMMLAIST